MRMEVHVQVRDRLIGKSVRHQSRGTMRSPRDEGHDFTLPRKASSEVEECRTVNRHR